jgi:D-beta-D-heptose 7-phosphate kinase/D-beta-D-heptose 1-phosphate adenosyltransferase
LYQSNKMSDSHIFKDLSEILPLIAEWRREQKTISFTNGCFDLLHPGHLAVLNAARQSADKLVVGLNSDTSVRLLKGDSRPIQDENTRARILSALRGIDAVLIFDDSTPLEAITAIRPDVLVKGGDYVASTVVGSEIVTGYGGRVVIAPTLAGHGTSKTITAITNSPR